VLTDASGLAKFTGLSIDQAGVKVLKATSAGLSSATSTGFTPSRPPLNPHGRPVRRRGLRYQQRAGVIVDQDGTSSSSARPGSSST